MNDFALYLILFLLGVIIGGVLAAQLMRSIGAMHYPATSYPAVYPMQRTFPIGSLLGILAAGGLTLWLFFSPPLESAAPPTDTQEVLPQEKWYTIPESDTAVTTPTQKPPVQMEEQITSPLLYFIQVTVSDNIREAFAEKNNWSTNDYYQVQVGYAPHERYPYKILLGPFTTRNEAEVIKQQQYPKSFIRTADQIELVQP